jgi:hypothetical protein
LAAIVIVVSAIVMITVMLLIRQVSPRGGFFNDSDRASGVFGFLGAGFVILLGFVIFLSFGTYDAASNQADAEAAAVVDQFQTASDFPGPLVERAEGQVICYARSVIAKEWPSMRDGERSKVTEGWVVALNTTGSKAQEALGADAEQVVSWWDATSEREVGRRGRMLVAQGQIPMLLWALLVIGAILVVGYVLLYADRDEGLIAQITMIGGTTVLVVASLLAVQVLAHPFEGQNGSIDPSGMEYSLSEMAQFAKADGWEPDVLCNQAGVPLPK